MLLQDVIRLHEDFSIAIRRALMPGEICCWAQGSWRKPHDAGSEKVTRPRGIFLPAEPSVLLPLRYHTWICFYPRTSSLLRTLRIQRKTKTCETLEGQREETKSYSKQHHRSYPRKWLLQKIRVLPAIVLST